MPHYHHVVGDEKVDQAAPVKAALYIYPKSNPEKMRVHTSMKSNIQDAAPS